ncbi:MAG: thiamine pyrophosphate-dependent enzyme [Candidatus Syntropharchaeia archaeon]
MKKGKSEIGIVSSGVSVMYAIEALDSLGLNPPFLKVGTYPVPEEMISELVDGVERVLVIEELDPVVEERVKMISDIEVLGKGSAHIPYKAELNVEKVCRAISHVFGREYEFFIPERIKELLSTLPPRPAIMCPGCPHRAFFYAAREVFGKNGIYPSDIGCYTLEVRTETVDTCLCMGASITIASGLSYVEERDIICTIGDSTFLHTGVPGLMNAVYNGARITIAILDNGTTAMTGHQPHPGTGKRAMEEDSKKVILESICRACGADFVEVVDSG